MKASLDICNESRLIRLSQVDNGSCVAANAGQIEMTSRSKNNEPTCPIAAECIAREGGGKRSFEQDALETTRRSAVMVESPGCGERAYARAPVLEPGGRAGIIGP